MNASIRWIVGVCLFAAVAAHADRVEFANGDVITGKITSIAGGKVVITTDYAARIVADREQIVALATDDPVLLRTGDGSGRFGTVSGTKDAISIDNQVETIALADISRVSRQNSAAAFEAADWAHKVDVAATLSKGNSSNESFSVLTESFMRKAKNEHQFNIAFYRDKDDVTTTRDQLDVDYAYKRFLADEKWFMGANAEYFKDALKDIDPRVTVGAGAGYRFWDNSLGSLTVEAGISAVYEDLGVDTETNPAARWALDYRRMFAGERMEFFHRHQLLKILDSARGEVIDASTGIRFLFAEWWDASIRADMRHETKPPPGSHQTDITYALGLGVRF